MEKTTQKQGKKSIIRCGKCSHCHLILDYDPIYGDLWCDSYDALVNCDPNDGCINYDSWE